MNQLCYIKLVMMKTIIHRLEPSYTVQTSGKQSDQKFLFKPGFPMIA